MCKGEVGDKGRRVNRERVACAVRGTEEMCVCACVAQSTANSRLTDCAVCLERVSTAAVVVVVEGELESRKRQAADVAMMTVMMTVVVVLVGNLYAERTASASPSALFLRCREFVVFSIRGLHTGRCCETVVVVDDVW